MSDAMSREPMLEMFIFEASQLLEQLEALILECDRQQLYSTESINGIFRIMHTIKGSSAMMLFNQISTLAHHTEDLFYYLRDSKPACVETSMLTDLVLNGLDFMKVELEKIKNNDEADGNATEIIEEIVQYLAVLKASNTSESPDVDRSADQPQQYSSQAHSLKVDSIDAYPKYKAQIYFEDHCEMVNIRAYSLLHQLREFVVSAESIPSELIEMEESMIHQNGLTLVIQTEKSEDELLHFLNRTSFLKSLTLVQVTGYDDGAVPERRKELGLPIDNKLVAEPASVKNHTEKEWSGGSPVHSQGNPTMISVHVNKLDQLMDTVGELVIAEAMVTQHPDLQGLELEGFMKAARQLRKITGELQDIIMSVRMVPLSNTFHKMHRIVRDMCKKLGKTVHLELLGEETEVDKNIIERISDPLMHLIRNALDHGIELPSERQVYGKNTEGTIMLEAKNEGSDVLILVRDDGKGLSKERILQRARAQGLLIKPEEDMTDKEIYQLIFLPGFSTKENVSEFSGRGVGMDVVTKSLEAIGGAVTIDSELGSGTCITLKIPLTLAIIDGMNIRVGNSCYTVPTSSIKESFRPRPQDLLRDPDGNELIMVRGHCYPILRLHSMFKSTTSVSTFTEGILLMVEQDDKTVCLFADELIGQQQVVVKSLPQYIKDRRNKPGLTGCTLLGDGSISLILDIGGLIQ